MEDRKYYVYFHLDILGNIRYIGSGTKNRYKSKNYRSNDHLNFWDSLIKVIIKDSLTKEESMEEEQKYILEMYEFGQLFNIMIKCRYNPVKEIRFSEMCRYLYVDETSPSGLRWKVDIFSGKNYSIKEVSIGDVAGRKGSRGYWQVSVNKIRYANHRIIWCLNSGKDTPCDMVVDHIDSNPSNNSIDNLRLVTKQQNNRHLTISKSNKTGYKGIQFNKFGRWVVCWYKDGRSFNKTFNPKKLYKDIPEDQAILLALQDAVNFRKTIEEGLYGV